MKKLKVVEVLQHNDVNTKVIRTKRTTVKMALLQAQERPATLIYTVTSGLRITRARHDYNRDAETGS